MRPPFVGTPSQIAGEWTHYVRTRAVDGFNLLPHLIPSSLTDIVDKLVPELQERGAYRSEYEGTTLREHLALPALPAR
jgi:alkanesulfonate monooxygenase SsuD/methylene tetrahydromethanopterin reductase-like flavin-dependent oxidoreductase (luciferase family)